MNKRTFLMGVVIGVLLTLSVSIAADLSENVIIYYNVNDIRVDNISKMPDQKPFILNGTTYVPLRYMSETFGYEVDWNANTKTIYLNSPNMDGMSSATQKPQIIEHHIDMALYQFGYTPNKIEVMEGDMINLTLTAKDVGHGFRIAEYDINEKLEAGETKTISFMAIKKGTFTFDCSVYCGTGHGSMHGELIVK